MTDVAAPTTAPLTMSAITARFAAPGGQPITVLDGLDLTVASGEVAVLSGRSGSGKTTALRIAAGLQPASEGEILWGQQRIDHLDDDCRARLRRRHIGYVPQREPLIDWLTAAENVALPAAPDGSGDINPDRVRELLQRFGVDHRSDHRPAALSAGEQQRVALARALLLGPPLLLLDEPTANLDRTSSAAVLAALRDLRADARGILVATHDARIVELADRAFELD